MDIKELKFSDLDLLKIGNTIAMSGAIWQGEEKTFITLFPDQELDEEVFILKMSLGDWEKLVRQSDLLEVQILQNGPNGVTKAIYRKSQRLIDNRIQWTVFKRDNYSCRYCGKDGVPLTVDHLILWEEGGPTIEENMVSSCRSCNKDRGNMHYEEWLKSTKYQKLSKNLTTEQKKANEDLLKILPNISKVTNIRSR